MPLPPGVQTAVSQLHDALTYSDAQLNRASHRLQSHYASVYAASSSHTNVYNVVARVRALHAELTSLRESVRQIHHHKAQFLAKSRQHIREQIRLLNAVHQTSLLQVQNSLPDLSDLHRIDAQLAALEADLDSANAAYFDAFDAKHPTDSRPLHTTTLAQPKPLSPAATQPDPATDTIPPSVANSTANAHPAIAPVNMPRGPVEEPTTPTTTFKPISKTAFNRLPRNLKVHAGRLDDINSFYKKVLDVFAEKSGRPLSEKQLLHATGEPTAQKLQALRGLTVLRRNKDDKWLLPTSK